jgi:hypothetical protein
LIKAARLDRLTPTLAAAKAADVIPLLPAPVAEHVEDPAVDQRAAETAAGFSHPTSMVPSCWRTRLADACGYCAAPETQGVARLAHFVSQLPGLIARIAAAPWL